MMEKDAWEIAALAVVGLLVLAQAATAQVTVSLVSDAGPGPAARHGLTKLAAALSARKIEVDRAAAPAAAKGGIVVVAGLASGAGPAAELLKAAGISVPAVPEALAIHNMQAAGKPALVVAGSDDRGLMYALLEVADRVGWAEDPARPLSEVKNAAEKPAVAERALSVYTFHRATFESRFFDEAYWARYLDMLAADRFNTFVLILGYENWGYVSPPYPYFFDIEGFPDVRVVGIAADQQKRYLAALNRLIQMAHERGLNFTLGIWDHIYRGGVQGPTEYAKRPTPGLVWGVTAENLRPFTKAALAKLLRLVPDLDAIQFRMHDESGLKPGEMEAFWGDVFDVVKASGARLRCDLRAKGLPDSVIDMAVAKGLRFRITTKYWAEQMGMPFHPTHIPRENQHDRRHGYADLLRYPQRYKMHWRLWNGGTARVLLWADPDYVRRFGESTHLYGGEGFEVNEMLATKMQDHPHDAKPFDLLRPPYRYYDYEFERYWHFYQVWGRVGYSPATPPEVWQREFQKRFGADAAPFLERGLHRASQVLPRVMAAIFPYHRFPMTRGWAEKQRWEDLPGYAKAGTGDTEQFLSFSEAARCRLEGEESAKVHPEETGRWLARASADVFEAAAEAEKRIGAKRGKEFDSTIVDLKIMANLALYHSRRIPAGLAYALFTRTHDPATLDDAIGHEKRAIEAWEALVKAAGDVYNDDLAFGRPSAGLSGHWKDELAALQKGLGALEQQRKDLKPTAPAAKIPPAAATGDGEPPEVRHTPIATAPPAKPLTITATVTDPSGVKWVRLRYRSVTQFQDYRTLAMAPAAEKNVYQAQVPAEHVDAQWDFMYFIEVMDNRGNGRLWPDLNKQPPYVVVRLQR